MIKRLNYYLTIQSFDVLTGGTKFGFTAEMLKDLPAEGWKNK